MSAERRVARRDVATIVLNGVKDPVANGAFIGSGVGAAAAPVILAIIGTHESVHNGPKTATRLRQQLPEARIELVDDANHMILIDQPEIVEKLLVKFLQ